MSARRKPAEIRTYVYGLVKELELCDRYILSQQPLTETFGGVGIRLVVWQTSIGSQLSPSHQYWMYLGQSGCMGYPMGTQTTDAVHTARSAIWLLLSASPGQPRPQLGPRQGTLFVQAQRWCRGPH